MSNTSRLARTLLPLSPDLRLQSLTIEPGEVCATLVATHSAVPCPRCASHSRRIHSRYQSTLSDLPTGPVLKQVEREAGSDGRSAPLPSVPSARHAAHLLVQRPERLRAEEQAYLGRLCAQTPMIATAYTLAQPFSRIARERQGQHLEEWPALVQESGISELRGYTRGLDGDRVSVRAGLRLVWSNGQKQGQVNKLKLLKRQMYGRANFDLLACGYCTPRSGSASVYQQPGPWPVV